MSDDRTQRYFNVIENRREIAQAQFGILGANEVFDLGKRIFTTTRLIGPLNALEIAMQIYLEFEADSGKVIDRAERMSERYGTDLAQSLIGAILEERARRA